MSRGSKLSTMTTNSESIIIFYDWLRFDLYIKASAILLPIFFMGMGF